MGDYEVIDFVVMLMATRLRGEPTLEAFYQRLLPFAEPFMALFGRTKGSVAKKFKLIKMM